MRFTAIIITFLFLITSCGYKKAQINNRKIQFHDTISIGTVSQSDTLTINQSFTNHSNQEIKIFAISSECGCLTPYLEDSIIRPGQKVSMRVNYIPSVSNDSGAVAKIISFRSDEDDTIKSFFIKGEVRK